MELRVYLCQLADALHSAYESVIAKRREALEKEDEGLRVLVELLAPLTAGLTLPRTRRRRSRP